MMPIAWTFFSALVASNCGAPPW